MTKKQQKSVTKTGGSSKGREPELLSHSSEAHDGEKPVTVPTGSSYSVGAILRQARQEKDKTVHDVANAINIRVSQIQALEEEKLSDLPGMTYALGFLRSYAQHLGLDAGEIVRHFKETHQKEVNQKPELVFPVPASETLVPGPRLIWTSLAVFFLIVAIAGIFYVPGNSGDKIVTEPSPELVEDTAATSNPLLPVQPEQLPMGTVISGAPVAGTASVPMDIPSVENAETLQLMSAGQPAATAAIGAVAPPAATTEMAPATATPDSAAATQPPVASAEIKETTTVVMQPAATPQPKPEERKLTAPKKTEAGGRIEIRAKENSWIQVTDAKGKVVVRKVLRPGDVYSVPDQPGLELVTANAGGLVLSVDGTPIKAIGKSGDIVRGFDLNPAKLRKR